MPTNYRVAFVWDSDASFEESNGESRPMTEAEYAGNEFYGCPDHPRAATRAKSPTEQGIGICTVCGKRSEPIPYAEYLAYYGNPEMHVYIGTIIETQSGIGDWTVAESMWRSDLMTDDPALHKVHVTDDEPKHLHYYDPATARKLPGYFGELAREMLSEAGYKPKPYTRKQMIEALREYYSEKFAGKVYVDYDDAKRKYCIHGEGLPAHPDLQSKYPNGWSLLDYIAPAKAREIVA